MAAASTTTAAKRWLVTGANKGDLTLLYGSHHISLFSTTLPRHWPCHHARPSRSRLLRLSRLPRRRPWHRGDREPGRPGGRPCEACAARRDGRRVGRGRRRIDQGGSGRGRRSRRPHQQRRCCTKPRFSRFWPSWLPRGPWRLSVLASGGPVVACSAPRNRCSASNVSAPSGAGVRLVVEPAGCACCTTTSTTADVLPKWCSCAAKKDAIGALDCTSAEGCRPTLRMVEAYIERASVAA